jgi:hypothetical protein
MPTKKRKKKNVWAYDDGDACKGRTSRFFLLFAREGGAPCRVRGRAKVADVRSATWHGGLNGWGPMMVMTMTMGEGRFFFLFLGGLADRRALSCLLRSSPTGHGRTSVAGKQGRAPWLFPPPRDIVGTGSRRRRWAAAGRVGGGGCVWVCGRGGTAGRVGEPSPRREREGPAHVKECETRFCSPHSLRNRTLTDKLQDFW